MTKTRGLAGRARGKSRARPERSSHEDTPQKEILLATLDRRFTTPLTPAEVQKLDLKRFLVDTAEIDLPPADRLRHLAIHAERWCSEPQPEGWVAIERIYDRALQLAGNEQEEAKVLHARAVTAHQFATVDVDEDGVPSRAADRIRRDAYRSVHEALQRAPDHVDAHYTLGVITVEDPDGDMESALAAFDAALKRDPGYGWARFYRALCLHDLERWTEALADYDALSPSFFVGPRRAWRLEVYLDGRAHCALRAGHVERAQREMTALVERYEKDLRLALDAPLVSLVAAAAGPFYESLGARVRKLCVHVEDRNLVKTFDELRRQRGVASST